MDKKKALLTSLATLSLLAAANPAFAEETVATPVAEPTVAAEAAPAADPAPVADAPVAEEAPVADAAPAPTAEQTTPVETPATEPTTAPVAEGTTVTPDSSQTDYAFSNGQGGYTKEVTFLNEAGQVIYDGTITGKTLSEVFANLGLPTDARLTNVGFSASRDRGFIYVSTLTAADGSPLVTAPVAEGTTVTPDSSQTDYAFSNGQGGYTKEVTFLNEAGQVIYDGTITGKTLSEVFANLGLPTDARLTNVGFSASRDRGFIYVSTLTAADGSPLVTAPVAEGTTVTPDSSQTDYAFSDGQGGTAKQVRFFAASGQVIYQGPITGATLGQVLAELGLPTDARLSNIGWVADGLGGTILVGTLTAADGSPLTAKGESVVAEDKPTLTGLNITKDGVTAKGEGLTAEDKPVYVPATNTVESTKPATAGKAVEVPKPSYSRVEAAKTAKADQSKLPKTGEVTSLLGLLGSVSLGLATIVKRRQQ